MKGINVEERWIPPLIADCHSPRPERQFPRRKLARIGRKYPTTGAVCDVCGGSNLFAVEGEKKRKAKREGGEGKGRIATPLLPIGVEAPVQSSWHTYELCIRRSLCAIVRCIIIPEKVSATIPSGTYMDIRGTDGKMYGMGSSRRGAG